MNTFKNTLLLAVSLVVFGMASSHLAQARNDDHHSDGAGEQQAARWAQEKHARTVGRNGGWTYRGDGTRRGGYYQAPVYRPQPRMARYTTLTRTLSFSNRRQSYSLPLSRNVDTNRYQSVLIQGQSGYADYLNVTIYYSNGEVQYGSGTHVPLRPHRYLSKIVVDGQASQTGYYSFQVLLAN